MSYHYKALNMVSTQYFSTLIENTLKAYFNEEEYPAQKIPGPETDELFALTGQVLSWEEYVILSLALMPHIHPQVLDVFFIKNAVYDRPFTEFGGWEGVLHKGFLPTGETAAFLITGGKSERRSVVSNILSKNHWFYTEKILHLDHAMNEPFLSGKLLVTKEFLDKVFNNPVLKS